MCENKINCDCGCSSTKLTIDKLNIIDNRINDDGFLVAKVILARDGIQQYRAYEIGFPAEDPNQIISVYRPRDEVFNAESMKSFNGKPVTNEHPPEKVTVDNVKNYMVGYLSKEVYEEDGNLVSEIVVTDKSAIEDILSGKVEVSNGYSATYDFSPGVTSDGVKYDAMQKNIVGNHVAIVSQGRCGSQCKIMNTYDESSNKEEPPMPDEKLNLEVEGEVTVEELKKALSLLQDEMKMKDEELFTMKEKLKAQEDEYKTSQAEEMSVKELDEKIEVIDTARKVIKDFSHKGKTISQIKKEVIAAKHNGVTVDNKSDAYIEARFDIIKESIEKKSSEDFSSFVGDSLKTIGTGMTAREIMLEKNKNLWSNK